ncbi:MAG TPA: efflux RND transporter periplasmic adaptor subunit [Fimbriimonadales bacterium]|nr:efflux RND transporter periplasmic adaptor subunit [Fimbriimonadales bacterium]
MKKRLFLFALLIVVIGFIGFRCLRPGSEEASAPQTAKVERGELLVTVVESGNIEAVTHVEVKSRVSGRVSEIVVEEGDRIEKGDLIGKIDPQELRLQLEQTSAQLKGAESVVRRSEKNIPILQKELKEELVRAEARYLQAKRAMETQPALSQNSIQQARAAYEQAKQALELLISTTHPRERVNAEAEVRKAKATFENDKRNYERQVSLYQKGYVSERSVNDARTQMELSEANYQQAQDALARLKSRHETEVKNAQQNVKQAEAALNQALANAELDKNRNEEYREAKAAYEQAKNNLNRVELERQSLLQAAAQAEQLRIAVADNLRQLSETEIRAPISGVVTRKLVEPGELVTALSSFTGGTTVVEIADLSQLRVKLEVNEIDVAKIRKGMKAEIEIDAFPDRKFSGVISKIAPANVVEATATTASPVVKYGVEVLLTERDTRIKPGMSAKCTIKVLDKKNVLKVPIEYVGKDSKGFYVMVAKEVPKKGKPPSTERREVRVGASSATHMEILSGVREGETVVMPPYEGPPRKGAIQIGEE